MKCTAGEDFTGGGVFGLLMCWFWFLVVVWLGCGCFESHGHFGDCQEQGVACQLGWGPVCGGVPYLVVEWAWDGFLLVLVCSLFLAKSRS